MGDRMVLSFEALEEEENSSICSFVIENIKFYRNFILTFLISRVVYSLIKISTSFFMMISARIFFSESHIVEPFYKNTLIAHESGTAL